MMTFVNSESDVLKHMRQSVIHSLQPVRLRIEAKYFYFFITSLLVYLLVDMYTSPLFQYLVFNTYNRINLLLNIIRLLTQFNLSYSVIIVLMSDYIFNVRYNHTM